MGVNLRNQTVHPLLLAGRRVVMLKEAFNNQVRIVLVASIAEKHRLFTVSHKNQGVRRNSDRRHCFSPLAWVADATGPPCGGAL